MRCSLIYHCCNVWYATYIVVLLFTVSFVVFVVDWLCLASWSSAESVRSHPLASFPIRQCSACFRL